MFQNGIDGLRKDIKIQLIFKDNDIILPLAAAHNVPGKYYAFVTPTVSGFYQANILGQIHGTPISLSMHPPKVNDRTQIEFPQPLDLTLNLLRVDHDALAADVEDLKQSVTDMESAQMIGYAGIVLGVIGIAVAATALARSKNKARSSMDVMFTA